MGRPVTWGCDRATPAAPAPAHKVLLLALCVESEFRAGREGTSPRGAVGVMMVAERAVQVGAPSPL
jgi:hypothetical protein